MSTSNYALNVAPKDYDYLRENMPHLAEHARDCNACIVTGKFANDIRIIVSPKINLSTWVVSELGHVTQAKYIIDQYAPKHATYMED